jgi:hypothetical protein
LHLGLDMKARTLPPGRTARRVAAHGVDATPIEQLLELHERLFAPLDPKGEARLLQSARQGAWSGRWRGMDGLAA